MIFNLHLQSLFTCTAVVALAEVGDKTQLLALLLAARFRKPGPMILAILVATLLNHAVAGWVGMLLAGWLTPNVLRWTLGLAQLAMAVWVLIPDKLDADEQPHALKSSSVFFVTFVAFFLAEMGDKTQIATVALAARFQDLLAVVLGTTMGMMLANVPVVLLGQRAAQLLPASLMRVFAAALFLVLGVLTLTGLGARLGF